MTTSSQILTDIASAISTGPSAATLAKALNANGPIIDMLGTLVLLQKKAYEVKTCCDQILAAMDSGDGIKSTIQNIHDTFV